MVARLAPLKNNNGAPDVPIKCTVKARQHSGCLYLVIQRLSSALLGTESKAGGRFMPSLLCTP